MTKLIKIQSREKIYSYIALIATIIINIINLLACSTFIIEDYFSEDCPSESASSCEDTLGQVIISRFELAFSFIFIIELCFNFKNQQKPKLGFFLKTDTWVDIITSIPPILNLILESQIKIGFLRMLRMLKVMRIVRVLKVMKKANANANQNNDS